MRSGACPERIVLSMSSAGLRGAKHARRGCAGCSGKRHAHRMGGARYDDMLIRIGYDLRFELAVPTAMIAMLRVHPSRAGDLVAPERVCFEPASRVEEIVDV